jgi:hypothetical protein
MVSTGRICHAEALLRRESLAEDLVAAGAKPRLLVAEHGASTIRQHAGCLSYRWSA